MSQQHISLRFTTLPEITRAVFKLMEHIIKSIDLNEFNRDRFMLAVGEAIDNAVIHGNKFATDKFVDVECLCESNKIIVMVMDQGAGFDFQKHLNTPLSEFEAFNLIAKTIKYGSPGGLGLALMRKCCDEVLYQPPGNKVTFVKYLE